MVRHHPSCQQLVAVTKRISRHPAIRVLASAQEPAPPGRRPSIFGWLKSLATGRFFSGENFFPAWVAGTLWRSERNGSGTPPASESAKQKGVISTPAMCSGRLLVLAWGGAAQPAARQCVVRLRCAPSWR
jgi:hypothetical protein